MIEHIMAGIYFVDQQPIPVTVDFTYDEDEPLFIGMSFRVSGLEDVYWEVSRELALRGVTSKESYGEGDVRFQYQGVDKNILVICLTSLDGHADVMLPQSLVAAFLEETTSLVRFGGEITDADVDRAIEEILNS